MHSQRDVFSVKMSFLFNWLFFHSYSRAVRPQMNFRELIKHNFLQTGCFSYYPTNSFKAPKDIKIRCKSDIVLQH